jgi:protein-S-isoprenylcysteine O-methyltransferase Ste14
LFSVEPDTPLLACLLAWVALGIGMAAVRARRSGPASRRDPRSLVGLGIQSLAASLVFAVHRELDRSPSLAEAARRWAGVLLAWASAALAIAAIRVLGRHWSLQARLLPGHRLVREGPYAHVRHPIYAAMLGLLVGTGLNVTPWLVLAAATALYLAGTWLRLGTEDALLRQQFGDEFVRYAAEVHALWPGRAPRTPAPVR